MPLLTTKPGAAKAAPVDRSGLAAEDWLLIALDNAFRDADAAAVELDACRRKLDRLGALLDDPALAAAYPSHHPDRVAAVGRHAELRIDLRRHRGELGRAAKRAADAWDDLPRDELRAWYRDGAVGGWADSPVWEVVATEAGAGRLPFWADAVRAWRHRPREDGEPCPF